MLPTDNEGGGLTLLSLINILWWRHRKKIKKIFSFLNRKRGLVKLLFYFQFLAGVCDTKLTKSKLIQVNRFVSLFFSFKAESKLRLIRFVLILKESRHIIFWVITTCKNTKRKLLMDG